MIQEIIKEIRSRLRLRMNGVLSTSMREKGMRYKLIFGVTLPELREIAVDFKPVATAELADVLWQEDVRELKLLAVMLHPVGQMNYEKACQWVGNLPYPEVAEQGVFYLFRKISCANLLMQWCLNEEQCVVPYASYVGFLLMAHLGRQKDPYLEAFYPALMQRALAIWTSGKSYEKMAVLQALQAYVNMPGMSEPILQYLSQSSDHSLLHLLES